MSTRAPAVAFIRCCMPRSRSSRAARKRENAAGGREGGGVRAYMIVYSISHLRDDEPIIEIYTYISPPFIPLPFVCVSYFAGSVINLLLRQCARLGDEVRNRENDYF